jgi:hypothetical protein
MQILYQASITARPTFLKPQCPLFRCNSLGAAPHLLLSTIQLFQNTIPLLHGKKQRPAIRQSTIAYKICTRPAATVRNKTKEVPSRVICHDSTKNHHHYGTVGCGQNEHYAPPAANLSS